MSNSADLRELRGSMELMRLVRAFAKGDGRGGSVESGTVMVAVQPYAGASSGGSAGPGTAVGESLQVGPISLNYPLPKECPLPDSIPFALNRKRVLALVYGSDEPWKNHADSWTTWLLSSSLAGKPGSISVDCEFGARRNLTEALHELSSTPEVLLFAVDAARFGVDALLRDQLEEQQQILNALFVAVKHLFPVLEQGEMRLAVLVFNAWTASGIVNPFTGLTGGFIKSLARDLPDAHVYAINTDQGLHASLDTVAAELGCKTPREELPETFYRGAVRYKEKLARVTRLWRQPTVPVFTDRSVVLATGGARGVTSVLIEEIVNRYRCIVIAVGRTSSEGVPQAILEMTEQELRDHEATFYKSERAKNPIANIIALKRTYQRYVAANEIEQTRKRLNSLGGTFEYLSIDITDPVAVEKAMTGIVDRYGPVNVVIHGAGTQISKAFPKKTVDEFNSVVSAKLVGLRNLCRAIATIQDISNVHFHILTSAFSFWGNDGQPDYGAANEAMNRTAAAICERKEERDGNWSSLAWLGWAGIGMTRGSEYASLAVQRGLYPVTKEEGREVFSNLMKAIPQHSVHILSTPNEIAFYKVPVEMDTPTSARYEEAIDISVGQAPYLRHHLVDGVPTMPGAVELTYGAQAAYRATGLRTAVKVRNAKFRQFLRSYEDRPNAARVVAEPIDAPAAQAAAHVTVLSDFVHKSGKVLRKDVIHFEADVDCAVAPVTARTVDSFACICQQTGASEIADPYITGAMGLSLSGPFDCLRNIVVHADGQTAHISLSPELKTDRQSRLLVPAVLFDALWRLSVMRPDADTWPLYVPIESGDIDIFFAYNAYDLYDRIDGASLMASAPVATTQQNGYVIVRRALAFDRSGNVLIDMHDIVAKRNG